MKVLKRYLPILICTTLFTACASKPVKESENISTKTIDEKITEQVSEDTTQDEDEVFDVEEPTPEEIFVFGLEDISIEFTGKPKYTTLNRAFVTDFTFVVKKEETPVSDYAVTISYPSEKNEDGIKYTEVQVLTDENGTYTFKPGITKFSASTKITVYPTPISDSEAMLSAALEHKAQADWKVRSDIISKGAVLFIWDFNEKNRPMNNSYDVLSEFRTRGMTMVGNAPINETTYIGKPLSTLYKENYEIIEDQYGYLICGTIKFTKPVEPCDDGYLCSLVAEIQAVNMKNGKKVFESTFSKEATGANWNKCVSKCKEQLAEEIVDALVYGL